METRTEAKVGKANVRSILRRFGLGGWDVRRKLCVKMAVELTAEPVR